MGNKTSEHCSWNWCFWGVKFVKPLTNLGLSGISGAPKVAIACRSQGEPDCRSFCCCRTVAMYCFWVGRHPGMALPFHSKPCSSSCAPSKLHPGQFLIPNRNCLLPLLEASAPVFHHRNQAPASIRLQARLAQSAERKALNLVVVGSSPTVGVFAFCRRWALAVFSNISRSPYIQTLFGIFENTGSEDRTHDLSRVRRTS